MIIEYCSGGSLRDLIEKIGKLSEQSVYVVVKDVLTALAVLENHSVVHGDLKAANLMITAEFKIKLSDFGSASFIYGTPKSNISGSLYWLAPEIILNKEVHIKSDLWSLGCTVIELLTGKPPFFKEADPLKVLKDIGYSKKMPDFPTGLSMEMIEVVDSLLVFDPEKRKSIHELLAIKQISESDRRLFVKEAGLSVEMTTERKFN